jgi:hypothetical protein
MIWFAGYHDPYINTGKSGNFQCFHHTLVKHKIRRLYVYSFRSRINQRNKSFLYRLPLRIRATRNDLHGCIAGNVLFFWEIFGFRVQNFLCYEAPVLEEPNL